MRLILLLCLCLPWFAFGESGAVSGRSYRISNAESTLGGWNLKVLVLSVSEKGGEVALRVGFAWSGVAETSRFPMLGNPVLASVAGARELPMDWSKPVSSGGSDWTPEGTLVGEVLGPWRGGIGATESQLTFRCPPFPPVTFVAHEGDQLTPIDVGDRDEPWNLDFEQIGEVEAMANIALILRAARVSKGCLELGIAFRNESRFALNWRADIQGSDARLVTLEGESLMPLEVSDGLSASIAPLSGQWNSGQEVSGTVQFPLPDPLAGHEVQFVFPGYAAVNLLYDGSVQRWIVAPRAKELKPVREEAERLRAEELLFRELEAFWSDLSRRVSQRDYARYQTSFSSEGGVRANQMSFLAGLEYVPVTSLNFHLPTQQRLSTAGGRVRNLKVELRYQLAGLPRSNEFVTLVECDLERTVGESMPWRINRFTYEVRPPFWTLGFTQVESSDHFLVFHKKNANDNEKARLAIRQMERAYEHLSDEGISLGTRYAGFVIPDGDDFRALTGRDPQLFSGASSATYVERNGVLKVINQALFINDFRFFSMRRLWGGRSDRQITIQHELLHLALAEETRPWTPAWLVEGAAVVFGGQMKDIRSRAPKEVAPDDMDLGALSQLPSLGVGLRDGSRVLSQYLQSARAVEWLIENHGRSDVLAFYGSFAELAPKEWSASGGRVEGAGEKRLVTESPAMQAARLRLVDQGLQRFFAGLSLADLNQAIGEE